VLALPTTPLAVAVGYGYGIALGLPVALVGVVVTAVPVFVVARRVVDGGSAQTALRTTEQPGHRFARAERLVDRYYGSMGPLRGIVASRLAPIPSDVSTCAAAIGDVRLRQFLLGTLIGELPWTVAGVVVGASTPTLGE
jgi:uncharacterized membrane protein YdjX (TVP38/TMEM64 family)